MHKALLLIMCLLWVPCWGFASGPPIQPETRNIEIAILLSFDNPSPRLVVEQMRRELEAIMASDNFQLRWRVQGEDDPAETFERIIVARFKGHCSVWSGETSDVLPGPLAVVDDVDGEILPFADVYCDRVVAAIDSALRVENFSSANLLLGRAMARVLAHEMYHIFAGTAVHEKAGLAKCPLSTRDLTSSRFRLNRRSLALMREKLTGGRNQVSE